MAISIFYFDSASSSEGQHSYCTAQNSSLDLVNDATFAKISPPILIQWNY